MKIFLTDEENFFHRIKYFLYDEIYTMENFFVPNVFFNTTMNIFSAQGKYILDDEKTILHDAKLFNVHDDFFFQNMKRTFLHNYKIVFLQNEKSFST